MATAELRDNSDRLLTANGRVVYEAAAAGILPDPQELVSVWSERHRVVPEMGSRPGRWRNEVAPYLVEVMDALSPEDVCERVVLIKPAQSGGSAVAENWLGYIMHRTPGPAMYIGPTVQAAVDWYQEKLGPTIAATPVLAPARGGVVAPTKSRSGEGSTTKRIRFRGGFMNLAGSNSAATLRQHSIRFMVRDDRSAWTDNADGEGDPVKLSDARLKTYRVDGLSKVFDVSTPKFEGADIDADYERGDRRRYYLRCLGCAALTDYEFEDLVHNNAPPYKAHVVCPACGRVHVETDKADMMVADGWIATAPDPETGEVPPRTIAAHDWDRWRARVVGDGAIKSFAITGMFAAFERWDNLLAEAAEAGDDPVKVQPFQNSVLGRAYKPKTDVPEWETLSSRRESDWHRGSAPAGVLFVTLSVDVQGDGLYFAYLGWGPGKQTWHLDYGFLAGKTDVANDGAWKRLDETVDRGILFGGTRIAADLIGVDSGYNAEPVYAWVKRRHNALALKGEDGWSKLPIFRSKPQDIRKGGRQVGAARRYGMRVWLVGTWGIKGALMVYLGRAAQDGETVLPNGYQHYPADAERAYFEHLVAEYVAVDEVNGEKRRSWKVRGPNHWLDCNVYGWALTHYAGLWNWDEDRWAQRAAELADLLAAPPTDLFDAPPASVSPVAIPHDGDGAVPPRAPATPIRPRAPDDGLEALKQLNR